MSPEKEIQSYIDELVLGSSSAWRVFIQKYNSIIIGTAMRYASGLDPEDIAGRVYEKCVKDKYKVLRNFKGNSWTAFFVYIKEIARFIALAESKKLQKEIFPLEAGWEENVSSNQKPLHQLLEESEFKEKWDLAIMQLETQPREVIYYLSQGYTHQEIANLMNSPLNTVLSWSSRAKKKLKKILDKDAVLQ